MLRDKKEYNMLKAFKNVAFIGILKTLYHSNQKAIYTLVVYKNILSRSYYTTKSDLISLLKYCHKNDNIVTNVHTRLIIILIKLSIINPISKIFYEHVKEILKAFNHH